MLLWPHFSGIHSVSNMGATCLQVCISDQEKWFHAIQTMLYNNKVRVRFADPLGGHNKPQPSATETMSNRSQALSSHKEYPPGDTPICSSLLAKVFVLSVKKKSDMTPKNLELQSRDNILSQTDISLLPRLDLGSYLRRPGKK